MNTIGQISEINFKIGEIFISEWTLSLSIPKKLINFNLTELINFLKIKQLVLTLKQFNLVDIHVMKRIPYDTRSLLFSFKEGVK